MSRISLPDFFRYYSNTKEQQEAVAFLESVMPVNLLEEDSHWVELYRQQPAKPNYALTPGSSFDTRLTKDFIYAEFTNGGEDARRFVNQAQCDIAVEIAQFLQKARGLWGPMKITSGHRPPAINAACGGASQSEHLYQPGCGAVDCYPINGKGQEFEDWCDREWPFSVGYGMQYRGFVHLGIRNGRPRVRWDY